MKATSCPLDRGRTSGWRGAHEEDCLSVGDESAPASRLSKDDDETGVSTFPAHTTTSWSTLYSDPIVSKTAVNRDELVYYENSPYAG